MSAAMQLAFCSLTAIFGPALQIILGVPGSN